MAERLKPLMEQGPDRIRLDRMVECIDGEEGLGPILFVLTLPVLLPLPPGVSMVAALPVLVVAPQILRGRQTLWLPHWLARRTVDHAKLIKLLQRIFPWLQRVEALVRPRFAFLTGRVGEMLAGLACTLIGVLLVLPIPFANFLPSWSLCAFSLGLTRKDGVGIIVGYGLLLLSLAVIALAVFGLDLGFNRIRSLI